MIYWPADALQQEPREIDWKHGLVLEGFKVLVNGSKLDLPSAGFRHWKQDGETADAKKKEAKYTLKQIQTAVTFADGDALIHPSEEWLRLFWEKLKGR